LQDGFGPQLAEGELCAHELVDPYVEDVDKALDLVPVFLDDVLTQMENVKGHRRFSGQRLGDLIA